MRRLIEPGVAVVFGAARPAPQRQVAHPPALALGFASWQSQMHGIHEIFCGMPRSKRMPVRTSAQACVRTMVQASDNNDLSCKFKSTAALCLVMGAMAATRTTSILGCSETDGSVVCHNVWDTCCMTD